MSRPYTSQKPPSVNGHAAPRERGKRLTQRQYVRFAFYKIDPAWRRLRDDAQAEHKRGLAQMIRTFGRHMLLRPYSTMGTRADAELLLWQIAPSPAPFQELATAIARTKMGAYLDLSYSYLSQTKRSIYEIRGSEEDGIERLVIDPSEAQYVFVYPFIKTRDWYQMSLPARQGVMDEHIEVGRRYPSIRLNTTYSFGLDDYEFILAFETDEPSDFLDLVQSLRETEASRYTLQDTPLFTCINMSLEEALDALGGPPIATPRAKDEVLDEWVNVCAVEELSPGESRTIFLAGKMVALFNVDGELFALNNRCSHARGPLAEGEVDPIACTVSCPWHYGKFDLRTGAAVDGVVNKPVERYRVAVRDGAIHVGTPLPQPAAESREQKAEN